MDGAALLTGQTVIVRDAHVQSIGTVADVEVPIDARIVNGRGRWLVPGLVDMHVHIRAVDLPAYVANGITTVRDLAGLDSVLDTAGRVERGEVLGRAFWRRAGFCAVPGIRIRHLRGPWPASPTRQLRSTNNSHVARHRSRFTKSCRSRCTTPSWPRPPRARRPGGGARLASRRNRTRHRHAGFDRAPLRLSAAHCAVAVDATRASGVWILPDDGGLIAITSPAECRPRSVSSFLADRRALLTALHLAGARILAGTDAGYLIPAGTTLHEELAELSAAGLTIRRSARRCHRVPRR
jgi:hypothetical protein